MKIIELLGIGLFGIVFARNTFHYAKDEWHRILLLRRDTWKWEKMSPSERATNSGRKPRNTVGFANAVACAQILGRMAILGIAVALMMYIAKD